MITRAQYIAGCDQELAMVQEEINKAVAVYTSNMEHVAECPKCDEIDNLTAHIQAIVEADTGMEQVAARYAVAVKMLHDERQRKE